MDDQKHLEVGYLEDIEVFDDAEDVKTVRFIGKRGTADVTITDETMIDLASTTDYVFEKIHEDMADLKELFSDY